MTAPPCVDPFAEILATAARVLEEDPQAADRLARTVLARSAAEPRARLILGASRRRLGDLAGARSVLEALAAGQPNSAPAHLELGLTLEALGEHAAALAPLRSAIALKPTAAEGSRGLARCLERLGDSGGALEVLRRSVEFLPTARDLARDLAVLLHRRQEDGEALASAERLYSDLPDDDAVVALLAACCSRVGAFARAAALYRELLERNPRQGEVWLSLGHALRAQGDRAGAVEAYRRCVTLSSQPGEAYWSLANLKSSRFSGSDEGDLRARLSKPDLPSDDRLHLHFALGRVLEQAGAFEESFVHYAAGCDVRRQTLPYDSAGALAAIASAREALSADVFSGQERPAAPAAPIFIVGLPRAGSTLIEQILASHTEVEGCGELPTLVNIARDLGRGSAEDYRLALDQLGPSRLKDAGNRYFTQTEVYRRLGRPRFVDKMPNNFHHVALIRLAIPGAKIIDARRAPMAAGFSLFKQHFAAGHAYSYDLSDIGAYYAAYEALMTRYDEVMPGAILRVDYERLVNDTEAEIRRLLDFCELEFERGCLAFHENARAVNTASSEQVRRPIFIEGLDQWRNYEPWLGPLAASLMAARATAVREGARAPEP